ncbi:galactose mutarotase [Adhaeribacter swui]|uniref:Aldose 1-epimerase n=1 Tax=Adhaeribacter swui TaxID=2086471 RepID=A0A7G7G9D6_9BACT|nr:aldose epimerase family protein [Adhaeribacter swui]QNF33770.1 galactose mutarotase [Adhaeribacter swui]
MEAAKPNISVTPWGNYQEQEVFLIRWENTDGSYVELTNYGATLVSVVVPEKSGKLSPVVLGFSGLEAYLEDKCYVGSTIGRFANRISSARFQLKGEKFTLEPNDKPNTNHGGFQGFHAKVFSVEINPEAVSFLLTSKDGEGGYPGTLNLKITYTWNAAHELSIRYQAVTDKPTIANFTNHAYFNLSGTNRDMTDHKLTVYAEQMLEMAADFLPTGKIMNCGNQAFNATKIKDRIAQSKGICAVNDYYILADNNKTDRLKHACTLEEETTGRRMDVFTTYPGVMVYTGDFLKSKFYGHTQAAYQPFDGICLECQHYPDSPNQPHFPPAYLAPGETYDESILFKFKLNV